MRFSVDPAKCTLCGACIAACPTDMVREKRGTIRISHVACIGCGHCLAICPTGAISFVAGEEADAFMPYPSTIASAESLLGLLQSRRTQRRFLPQPLSREILERLLEAARWIPTAANCQCQQFVVITDQARREHLREEIVAYYRRYAEELAAGSSGNSDKAGTAADRLETKEATSTGQAERSATPMEAHIRAAVPAFVKNAAAGRDRLFFGAPAVILIHAHEQEVLPEAACAFAAFALALMAEALGLGSCITAFASLALQALPALARDMGVPEGHRVYYVLAVGYPADRYQLVPPRDPLRVTWL